ncbi:MAG TPA: DUF411 domain-containing protein [Gemmatimonadales bacterium]|nr:DUF411 domain-containing protein [Gemmatimonadales bacterium]
MKIARLTVILAGLATAVSAFSSDRSAPPEMTVYKTPTCGCCSKWVDHVKAAGFTVKTIDQSDLSEIKADLGVTKALSSCHTALVGGYVIEGHVPAADIQRLLKEHPKIAGLAAPGMPGAGPGMDTSKEPYDVLAFDASGKTTVWAHH